MVFLYQHQNTRRFVRSWFSTLIKHAIIIHLLLKSDSLINMTTAWPFLRPNLGHELGWKMGRGGGEWRSKNLINLITTTVTIRPTAKGRLRADDLVTVLRRGKVRRRLTVRGGMKGRLTDSISTATTLLIPSTIRIILLRRTERVS